MVPRFQTVEAARAGKIVPLTTADALELSAPLERASTLPSTFPHLLWGAAILGGGGLLLYALLRKK